MGINVNNSGARTSSGAAKAELQSTGNMYYEMMDMLAAIKLELKRVAKQLEIVTNIKLEDEDV